MISAAQRPGKPCLLLDPASWQVDWGWEKPAKRVRIKEAADCRLPDFPASAVGVSSCKGDLRGFEAQGCPLCS